MTDIITSSPSSEASTTTTRRSRFRTSRNGADNHPHHLHHHHNNNANRTSNLMLSDPVGDALTEMVNHHPAFSAKRRKGSKGQHQQQQQQQQQHLLLSPKSPYCEFRWKPLLSRHNWLVLRFRLVRVWRHPLSELVAALRHSFQSLLALVLGGKREKPTYTDAVQAFFGLTVILLVVAMATSHQLILWSLHGVYLLSVQVACLLFDWQDLEKMLPPSLVSVWNRGKFLVAWIDSRLLLGRRFAGRDWNKHDFVWEEESKGSSADNRHSTLWDLPPPSIKLGRRLSLDREYLARDEWSASTVNHIVAIDFCYIMLREEHLRRLADRRRRQQRQQQQRGTADHKQHLSHQGGNSGNSFVVEEELNIMCSPPQPLQSPSVIPNIDLEGHQATNSAAINSKKPPRRRSSKVTVISTDLRRAQLGRMVGSPAEAIELRAPVNGDVEYSGAHLEEVDMDDDSLVRDDGSSDRHLLDDDHLSHEAEVRSITSNTSETAADLPWLDVGARIGMRLLNSAHIQRVMVSQEAKEKLLSIGHFGSDGGSSSHASGPGDNNNDLPKPVQKPVHSMWTSPTAIVAAAGTLEHEAMSCVSDSSVTSPLSDRIIAFEHRAMDSCSPLLPPLSSLENGGSARTILSPVDTGRFGMVDHTEFLGIPRLKAAEKPSHTFELANNSAEAGRRPDRSFPRRTAAAPHEFAERRPKRQPLQQGVKIAVPLFPRQPGQRDDSKQQRAGAFQMGTVISSRRIFVRNDDDPLPPQLSSTNCLTITVKLDKCYLRNGDFAELTVRVMDEWGPRYMPRHSKVPVGSCIATSFGIGVLVGWRVKDDCHVVRSLWQRRGPGSAHAYLNRSAIHSTIESAAGFQVQTKFGWGVVMACVGGGRTFQSSKFLVVIKDEGRLKGHVLELNRQDIMSCHGAQFIPIIEYIREAANYQIQLDNYQAALRAQTHHEQPTTPERELWHSLPDFFNLLWTSFLTAVEEDKDFDEQVNEFMTSIINFLERLDAPDTSTGQSNESTEIHDAGKATVAESLQRGQKEQHPKEPVAAVEPGFWIMNDLFGGIFRTPREKDEIESAAPSPTVVTDYIVSHAKPDYYRRAYSVVRILMKTVTIARAGSVEYPNMRLALAVAHEFLVFVRTLIQVQERNRSVQLLSVWKRAWEDISITFGPVKERLVKIGRGIAHRMEAQGRKAKLRVLTFVDTLLGDERLLAALEQGDWSRCVARIEIALVKSRLIEEESMRSLRTIAKFAYDHLSHSFAADGGAAARNSEKLALVAQAVQSLASPRRSLLKLFRQDEVMELLERILVRTYCKQEQATRMLTIHAANFQTLRQLRLLKDFSVAGHIWIPLLDAADEEFCYVVSRMPEGSKDFLRPLSSLFSLCVTQFHKINAGDLSKDWLAFLLEEDSVRIIQELDMKVILALQSFSRDVSDMMVVLPYYSSIDDDILKLIDEVDLDKFLKEASDAMDDPENFSHFVREKATQAIERFLNYLPKMSIPVEKRELGEGWVLTCHGADGGDLTLSDVHIKRENIVCRILGSGAIFFPMFGESETDLLSSDGSSMVASTPASSPGRCIEKSVLDDIRELLLQAQRYDCWKSGVGGVGQPPSDRYVASVLHDLPVSGVLNCGIELWRNLEIDDDELLEIAIRDVSYQIKLQQDREEGAYIDELQPADSGEPSDTSNFGRISVSSAKHSSSFEIINQQRFNPRVDPTVLFLEMKKLNLQLDHFIFRIEKDKRRTVFDPIFQGRGMVSLHNISIRMRIECARERIRKSGLGGAEVSSPILHIRELQVDLERVNINVRDTGFGSDWLLNRAVQVFADSITKVVEENLREKISEQAKAALENLNSYFSVHPTIFFSLFGISMDDLEENVIWV